MTYPLHQEPDIRQYCNDHKQLGHSTDRCYSLRDRINKLILEGKLNLFRKDQATSQQVDSAIPRAFDKETGISGPHGESDSEEPRIKSRDKVHCLET